MGVYSWKFADVKGRLILGKKGYLAIPKCFQDVYGASAIEEPSYQGYGKFRCYDVYELVADWNREFLSQNPDLYLPGIEEKVSDLEWYKYYSNLSLTPEEIEEKVREEVDWFEYRSIGIDIACYDEDNALLQYPIKICKNLTDYEKLPASRRDPMQGCY